MTSQVLALSASEYLGGWLSIDLINFINFFGKYGLNISDQELFKMLIMLSPGLKYTFREVYTMRKPLKAEKKLSGVRRAKKTDF